MIIKLDNTLAKIKYDTESADLAEKIDDYLYQSLADMVPGARFAKNFSANGVGGWDGKVHLYSKSDRVFAVGLLKRVEKILDANRFIWGFTYEVFDNRPDSFVKDSDIEDAFTLDNGNFILRDYQREAVKDVFNSGHGGILNSSVSSGKCVVGNTYLLTNTGYKKIRSIVDKSLASSDNKDGIVQPYSGLQLINRKGVSEKPIAVTLNGRKNTIKIETRSGLSEVVTPNHPLLVVRNSMPEWVKANNIKVGDHLVERIGTETYGNAHYPANDAYALGALVADGTLSQENVISMTSGDKRIVDRVYKFLSKYSNASLPKWDNKNHYWYTRLFGKDIVATLHRKYKIPYSVAKGKKIPDVILESDKETQIQFLSGYFECEMSYSKDKHIVEVTSASHDLVMQVTLLLRNMGIMCKINNKIVKKYINNYYGNITIISYSTNKFFNTFHFITEQRKQQALDAQDGKRVIRNTFSSLPYPNEVLENYYKQTTKMYPNTSSSRRNYFGKPKLTGNGTYKIAEGIEKYPLEGSVYNKLKLLVDKNIIYDTVNKIEDGGVQDTYDVSVPLTHSFIGNGIINHNTAMAASSIKAVLPNLHSDERIALFTNNTDIFKQNIVNLKKFLGVDIGYLGGGKKKIKQVMVCMIPTVYSYLKIDPEANLKPTPKQSQIKKMATIYYDKFLDSNNPYKSLRSFVNLYEPIKKVDYKTKEMLEDILYACASDEDVIREFKHKREEYYAIVKEKNGDAVKKRKFIDDLLDSFVMFVADECVTGDTSIALGNGRKCPISKIHKGDKISTGIVTDITTTDRQPVYEIRTKTHALTGSIMHPVATYNKDVPGNIEYKPMGNIKIDDYVIVVTANHIRVERVRQAFSTNRYEKLYSLSVDTGAYVSNGILSHNCHHGKSDTWYQVLLACRNSVYKVGLSGSIDPNDPITISRLQGIFGGIIFKLKSKELVDNGTLAKPTIVISQINEPKIMAKGSKWHDVYAAGIVNNTYRNQLIAALAKNSMDNGKITLIIVQQLEHMKNIANYLNDLGAPYDFVVGDIDGDTRAEKIEKLREGKTKIMLATSVFDEGIDVANIDVLIMAAGGKSLRQNVQRVGRVLRKKTGKENKAIIFDFYDDTNKILRKHSNDRIEIYKNEQYDIKMVGK